jgi:hypothetical protein
MGEKERNRKERDMGEKKRHEVEKRRERKESRGMVGRVVGKCKLTVR